MSRLLWASVVTGLLATVVLIAACQGGPPTPTPTPTPTPINPEDLLARSAERMAALKTFAFRISHQGGGTALGGDLGLVMEEAEGVVARPDSLQLNLVGQAGGLVVKLSLVSVSGTTYMTNPFTGEWQEIEAAVNPLGFFDLHGGIAAIMRGVVGPAWVAQELTEDGHQAYHLRGRLPASALSSLLGTVAGEGTVQADIWLDADTLYLRRVMLQGQLAATEDPGIVRIIVLSGFNESVTIQPPI